MAFESVWRRILKPRRKKKQRRLEEYRAHTDNKNIQTCICKLTHIHVCHMYACMCVCLCLCVCDINMLCFVSECPSKSSCTHGSRLSESVIDSWSYAEIKGVLHPPYSG